MAKFEPLLRLMADFHNFDQAQKPDNRKTECVNDELFEEELDFIAAAGTTLLEKNTIPTTNKT